MIKALTHIANSVHQQQLNGIITTNEIIATHTSGTTALHRVGGQRLKIILVMVMIKDAIFMGTIIIISQM